MRGAYHHVHAVGHLPPETRSVVVRGETLAKGMPIGQLSSGGLAGQAIRRGRFDRLISEYGPLPFEVIPSTDTRRFSVPMHHLLKNRNRFWLALRVALRYCPPGFFTVADLGTYPGSFLRILRHFLPPERCRLIGLGLMISDDFRRAMGVKRAALRSWQSTSTHGMTSCETRITPPASH